MKAAQKRNTGDIKTKPAMNPRDIPDKVEALLHKAAGIAALASLYEQHWDEVRDGSLSDAMWAVQDLIQEARDLVYRIPVARLSA